MDAINSFGRPKKIELLVLVNRRFSRELPIEPNYVGMTVDAIDSEKVKVNFDLNNEKKSNVILMK
jgi:pyrimidine operon attenuation protein/uracil phosphoribosyltransferase